ncbi:pseudouridine synthase [Guyanagaster necrorhizus]|uniref:21S rRNA pseudouridine(2819) synthase n=1 Tax=Guyanagaster necrorhizus TaxID=856835 RepID=A0A9P7VLV4_9AGAR|nr:pseudouridine synthase [Guyanagaster necrorhizus MCA 3950]KAG7443581.1 pseudouridine synthase [Guyanagaster necrorhizus MCA 3950]
MTRLGFAALVKKARQSSHLLPRNDVLYLDKRVVVINKPPGLVSQASSKDDDQLNKFLNEIQTKHKLDGPLIPVHRLDKPTSGCLLLARSTDMARDLSRQFQQRKIDKQYFALVRSTPQALPGTSGVISQPLQLRDGYVSKGKASDPACLTEWELIASANRLSLLRLNLMTGHKHQIRFHLAKVLNAPILGEKLYSQMPPIRYAPKDRLFLHSSYRFRPSGPNKRYKLGIRSPMPPEFFKVCSHIGIDISPENRTGGVFIDDLSAENIESVGGVWMPRDM